MRSSMTKLRSTKKFEIVLDSNKLKWFYMSCAAALPQLDRGSDYESERHRFESYTPHQLKLKLPATGAFLLRKHRMDSNLGQRGLFLIDSCKISSMRLGEPVARSFFRRPIRVIFRGRASDIQAQVSRSQKALSGHARAACGTLVWRGLEALWRGPA